MSTGTVEFQIHSPGLRHAHGFTMVEMMVALVVLAVGMLGVASLFAISLHSGSDAIGRTQAVSLATDIADRIRANRFGGASYQSAGVSKGCSGPKAASCTAADLALDDHFVWDRQIQQAFPGGGASGSIAYDGTTAPPTYTIRVTWTEKTGMLTYQTRIQVPNT